MNESDLINASGQPRRKAISLYHWPVLVLFPSSLIFLTMEQMLVNTTYGRDDPEFNDAAIRWGMSGGLEPFILCALVGTVLLAAALIGWLYEWRKMRRINWPGMIWIALGVMAHPWVLGPIWEFFERYLFIKVMAR
jgi:hypothetical protein